MQDFDAQVQNFLAQFSIKGTVEELIRGLENTMTIALYGFIFGIVIGTLIAIVRVLPKNKIKPKSDKNMPKGSKKIIKKIIGVLFYIRPYVIPKLLDSLCTLYVGIFRGTPIVVQLLVFYFVILPVMGLAEIDSVTVAIIVFSMNSGAYISEIMRGGILSVDPGQMEGGRSVGMSYGATMLRIVIPQAVKNILPTLGNELIALVKETSVVSFVGVIDIYKVFRGIGGTTYEYMVPYLTMALIYIVIVMIITILIKIMERWLRKSDRGR